MTQADLWADRERQRLERDLEENRRKIQEPESRLLSSTGPAAGSTPEPKTMTIADEHGNPTVIPYDPMLMDAIRREQEVKARRPRGARWSLRSSASAQGPSHRDVEVPDETGGGQHRGAW